LIPRVSRLSRIAVRMKTVSVRAFCCNSLMICS
jgi:hypothetical protein